VTQAQVDSKELGALEERDPLSDDLLGGVDAAVRTWQRQFAVPAILATATGSHVFGSTAKLDLGKRDFDAVRARFAALDKALNASDTASRATLGRSQDTATWAFAGLVLVLACGAAAVWLGLRTWVTRPLGRLQRDVRQVASGSLEHQVALSGPPDLASLAGDVDFMRERIVAEVRSLAVARDSLAALNADLSRSNQELEQFAYVASHDLQEPLRKVVSFCQLLESRYADRLDERGHEYIAFAVDGATRMQVLINDLLAFSRVGRTTSWFTHVALGQALQDALANLDTAIRESKASITAGPLPVVRGDQALLTALFQNLIANAVKFTKSGRPEVMVLARRDREGWEISVQDNGIGIEPRFAERVFVIFQRLHGRADYGGTGIGLALCKKIVEFHGGRIWVDTAYRPGARLCFTLPGAEATPS
jgi:signal transduction histidine kinase